MHLSNEVIKQKVNVSKMKLRKLENKDADRMLEWIKQLKRGKKYE